MGQLRGHRRGFVGQENRTTLDGIDQLVTKQAGIAL